MVNLARVLLSFITTLLIFAITVLVAHAAESRELAGVTTQWMLHQTLGKNDV